MTHCDNCYAVALLSDHYCGWCGRDMRTNTFEPIDVDTEEGRKLFTERDKERQRRGNQSSDRGDVVEVLLYLERELSVCHLTWLYERLGGNVHQSMRAWLTRSIIGYPIPEILKGLEKFGWDVDELRAAVWSEE